MPNKAAVPRQYGVKPVARPTKYKEEYCDMILEYFDIDSGYDVEVENSKGVMQSVRHASNLPTLAGFARKIKVHRDTIHHWANEQNENGELIRPDFSDALKLAKECQEDILVQNGLKGGYNATFAIFAAKNIIGWRDTKEVTEDYYVAPVKIEVSVVDASANKSTS
jgi:hypothetical protein